MLTPLLIPLLAALGQAVPAANASAWSPAGKWVVRFDEDRCAAIREYGRGTDRLKIDILPVPMQEQWAVNLAVPERFSSLDGRVDAKLLVGNVAVSDVVHSAGASAREGYTVYSMMLNRAPLQRLRESGSLTFKTEQASYDIRLTDLVLVASTLDACMADLLETWGFPKEAQARLASLPKPVDGRIDVEFDDYPESAIRDNASGKVRFRLTINPSGRVKECFILKSSGHRDLDAANCKAARRTRFAPATDRSGRPIEAPYISYLTWRLHSQ